MKILLFGAGGQVGHALRALVPQNANLIAVDRSGLDLADIAAIAPFIHASASDLVINAAAYTAVDRAESEPELAYAINAEAPGAMAHASAESGARFIHISTDFVFDGTVNIPYAFDAVPNPINVYGSTKLAGERAVTAAGSGSLIIRTAWVYAAGGANFVETMLRLMTMRDEIHVVTDQTGTPTHADSLARAIWALAATDQSGIRHFTDAGVASWYDFAVAIHDLGKAAGLIERDVMIIPIPSSAYPTPAHRPYYTVLDKTATWAALGGPAQHWRHELAAMILKKRERADG